LEDAIARHAAPGGRQPLGGANGGKFVISFARGLAMIRAVLFAHESFGKIRIMR
jgi:hypothetical protein